MDIDGQGFFDIIFSKKKLNSYSVSTRMIIFNKSSSIKSLLDNDYTNSPSTPIINDFSESIRRFLLKKLPDYMIPNQFIEINEMPLTPSGKIDRKMLGEYKIEIDEKELNKDYFIEASNEIERSLCEILIEILTITKVNMTNSFYGIGGNSILAIKLCYRLNDKYGLNLRIYSILKCKSIAEISNLLESEIKLHENGEKSYQDHIGDQNVIKF